LVNYISSDVKKDKPDDFLEDVDGDMWHATDELLEVLSSDK